MYVIYGIKNCDTMKKAMKWLDDHGIEYQFHDYRKDGVDEKKLRAWCDEQGWQTLLNRRGTTWRKLPDEIKDGIDQESAIKLMLEQPAMIKRPVLDLGPFVRVGFKADEYEELLVK